VAVGVDHDPIVGTLGPDGRAVPRASIAGPQLAPARTIRAMRTELPPRMPLLATRGCDTGSAKRNVADGVLRGCDPGALAVTRVRRRFERRFTPAPACRLPGSIPYAVKGRDQ
jgi:hypothetical protein